MGPPSLGEITCPVQPSLSLYLFKGFLPERGLHGEIQESGANDFHPVEELIPLGKVFNDDLRDVVRRSLLRGCKGHGDGRGEVSPFGPLRRIEAERRPGRAFQLSFVPGSVQGAEQGTGHLFLHYAVGQNVS